MGITFKSAMNINSDILLGRQKVINEMREKGLYNENITESDMALYAATHIKCNIRPERLNPETPNGDAIV